jgi:hypothetical protein
MTPARLRVLANGIPLAALLGVGGFALLDARARGPSVEPELAASMGELQHHTHKLTLSIQAENPALAEFYLDEVEEVVRQIEQLFPYHDGHRVADLARAALGPRLAPLRGAVESSSWHQARAALSGLISGCNDCHAATGHDFIQIELTSANPFNQSFGSQGPVLGSRHPPGTGLRD